MTTEFRNPGNHLIKCFILKALITIYSSYKNEYLSNSQEIF
jgi:hypothetical protein